MTDILIRRDFNYDYPEDLVAQQPLASRGSSRLLFRNAQGVMLDTTIAALPELLPKGTLLLLNNTKVFPSRLFGTLPTGGKMEIFLLQKLASPEGTMKWRILARPMRKLKSGLMISFLGGLQATIDAVHPESTVNAQPTAEITFQMDEAGLLNWLQKYGYIPLPPYIQRKEAVPASESSDTERYQTVYAQTQGSVAAPTAGLHITDQLLEKLTGSGVEIAPVTLHVGGGTFLPVKTDHLDAHDMHEEMFCVSQATHDSWHKARRDGRPIFAVGTTSLRCMESYLLLDGKPETWQGTKLFLYPKTREGRYRPQSCDGILTNFHQPESTLLMLVAALIGFDAMKALYAHAVEERYRLFSYGDASLLQF